jgi:hypothetical protein
MQDNLRRKINSMSFKQLREALFDVSYAALSDFDTTDLYEALMKHNLPVCECGSCEEEAQEGDDEAKVWIHNLVEEVWSRKRNNLQRS